MGKLSKSAKKQLLNLLFVAVLIAVTITVLVVSFKEDGLSFENIGAFFNSAIWYYLLAAFGCIVPFILLEALALFLIARKLGHKSKFHQSIAYATADSYYSAITPSATGGQPASAFYMTRDGMGAGKASFALVVNLIAHSTAILIVGLVALILRPTMFAQIESVWAQILIIYGLVIQVLLLVLFIACMFFGKAIIKVGNWAIRVLTKMRIVKKPEKWQRKLEDEVEKFRSCRPELKKNPDVIIEAILLNTLQRAVQFLIPVFVCLSVKPDSDVITLFAAQTLVFYGYSCVPIPGGVGAYELMYFNVYGIHPGYDNAFIFVAMMISRVIQYYICMVITGVYTLSYHMAGVKNGKIKADDSSCKTEDGMTAVDGGQEASLIESETQTGAEIVPDSVLQIETDEAVRDDENSIDCATDLEVAAQSVDTT